MCRAEGKQKIPACLLCFSADRVDDVLDHEFVNASIGLELYDLQHFETIWVGGWGEAGQRRALRTRVWGCRAGMAAT